MVRSNKKEFFFQKPFGTYIWSKLRCTKIPWTSFTNVVQIYLLPHNYTYDCMSYIAYKELENNYISANIYIQSKIALHNQIQLANVHHLLTCCLQYNNHNKDNGSFNNMLPCFVSIVLRFVEIKLNMYSDFFNEFY